MRSRVVLFCFLCFFTSISLISREKSNSDLQLNIIPVPKGNGFSYSGVFFVDTEKRLTKNSFDESADFDRLNRKTRFKKVAPGQFKGLRPTFPFDIEFLMSVSVYEGKEVGKVSLGETLPTSNVKPYLVVSQSLYAYNHYLDSTTLLIGFSEEDGRTRVRLKGKMLFKESLISLVRERLKGAYPEKMKHLAMSLEKILLNR